MNASEITIETVKAIVTDHGFETSAACWEDERTIYACSKKSAGPGTYGHPAFEATFSRETGWLWWTGGEAIKVVA